MQTITAQQLSKKAEKALLEKAEWYYTEENYKKATELFEKLLDNNPSDIYYELMTGICYSYLPNKNKESLEILLAVKEKNPNYKEVDFHLARAYAVNERFDDAIEHYNIYLSDEEAPEDQKEMARLNILYCENAKIFMKDTLKVQINNIGSPINTKYSEYVPVITPDESVLIFTYRGEKSIGGLMDKTGKPDPDGDYYEDIYVSYRMGNEWLEPQSIGNNINTKQHDANIALSVDGQTLFIYKQTPKDMGDIYMSELNGEEWGKPIKLKGEVNTDKSWEGSASLTSNGQILYFASDREGGFGGRDLYTAELQPDGSWGNIKNLGPTINTKYDDDAPFIHPDNRTLYFSSKGHNSMGGYDIFYSYLDDNGWEEPVNAGYPVNTINDDRFYVLSADANTGYYSTSGRSKDGNHDIFTVTPGHFGKRPVLALVVGVVAANNEPIEADITVTNENTGEVESKLKSNSSTGKYMLALTPGNKYKIAIEVEGYKTTYDYIDVENLETYVAVEHDFNLVKEGEEVVSVADDENVLQEKIDRQIEKYNKEKETGYGGLIYESILKDHGTDIKEGVEYFIDLGEADIKGDVSSLEENGVSFKTEKTSSGMNRVTVGPFKNLIEAEKYKLMLAKVNPELEQSFVKVNDHGVEKTIPQYYPERYKGVEIKDVDLHTALTKRDSVAANQTNDDFLKDKAFELDDKEIVDINNEKNGMTKADEKVISGLTFKVEIAAVQDPKDFKYQHLEKYGKINAKTYPDGYTRYTFGPFKTLVEAEAFRQMLIEKEKEAEDAFVTVFVFGQRKTMEEYKKGPCENDQFIDFSWFKWKDLNDTAVYNKLIRIGGNQCAEGLEFKVQIAAYRHPENYKWDHLKQYGKPEIRDYPDGITRFTQGTFRTLAEAEVQRQKAIKSGQWDAWVTPFYNGKRMLMEELIEKNFYGKSIN
ncbi:MAG: hypothetical protein Kow0079_14530 [Vicingaceae bacterium]